MEGPDFSATPSPESRSHAQGSASGATKKPDLGKRAIAFIIDSLLAFVLGLVPVIGGLVGAAYMVVRDGLELDFMDRRSVGKRIMSLRPVRLDGQPMDVETSVRRNWMFGLGAVTTVLLWIPILGWLLALLVVPVALIIGLYEVYKVITDDEGRRWGDDIGATRVIETLS